MSRACQRVLEAFKSRCCVTELTLCDRLAISKTDLCRINWKKNQAYSSSFTSIGRLTALV